MAPFCIVDIFISFPCLPQPLPPKINDNIDAGDEGIYGV